MIRMHHRGFGCGANAGGCGCMASWDCALDNAYQRAVDALYEYLDSWEVPRHNVEEAVRVVLRAVDAEPGEESPAAASKRGDS